MKFGKVENPSVIDFILPPTPPETYQILKQFKKDDFEVFVGCAKWNKTDLKGFYPKGTKDELLYYSSQFNSIELNATFYKSPNPQQVATWAAKAPDNFKFFPKIPQIVSHFNRLQNVKQQTEEFCDAISHFEEKLGMTFLQMPDNFHPKYMDRVQSFIESFPKEIPLAVEMRHTDWFTDQATADALSQLLHDNGITHIIVDTTGRRDMLHMRLTSDVAFVRYVGANAPSDYQRLDDWIKKIRGW